MNFMWRIVVNMALFIVLSQIFSGGFRVDNWAVALLAAVILAVLNVLVKPILLFLTLPITIVTLGFFMIVINALMLELTAKFVSGFAFASFGWAMIIAFLISLANALLTSRVSVQKY